jgi:hypothetical protein
MQVLSDAHVTFEDAAFNPPPVNIAPGYQLRPAIPFDIVLGSGGGEDFQDKGQKSFGFQDDVTPCIDSQRGHSR